LFSASAALRGQAANFKAQGLTPPSPCAPL